LPGKKRKNGSVNTKYFSYIISIIETNMSDAKYAKIKHLVEVNDDILAVFTIHSRKESLIDNLNIGKNANVTRDYPGIQ
jgi:hypothetical protein